jgi:hypothetical protein
MAFAGMALTGFAGDITLAWDPVVSTELAGYQLCYGPASGQYSLMVDVGNVTTYTLTNLAPGTYYLATRAYGKSGEQSAFSNEVTAVVGMPADTTPPVISGVAVGSVTVSSAIISWTANEASDAQIEYGLTASYGAATALDATMGTAHSQMLSGLAAGTVYHFRVKSKDAAGNVGVSADYLFTTAIPADTAPPVISGVAGSNVTASSATITWTTNEASDTQVEYGKTTSYGSLTTLNTSKVTSHSQSLSGLTGSTLYHFRVMSKDAAGNAAVSGDFTFTTLTPPDTTPPVISKVGTPSISASTATVSWNTDESADSQVEYGTTTAYGSSTTLNSAMITSHSQSLSGLSAGTVYHYRVRSRDAAGNAAVSGDYAFTTQQSADAIQGLVAGYAFDEGTGTVSADLSGSGNTATLNGASWTAGKYGKGLAFNGTTSFVTAGVAGLPAVNQPKTISLWVYWPNKSSALQAIMALANPSLKSSVHYGLKNTQVGVMGYGDTWMLMGRLPSVKAWHHFGYVFDGTQNRLYLDGKLISTSTIIPAAAAVTDFQIGRWVGGSEYFAGSIDDVRIYSRALTVDELKLAMNTPLTAVTTTASNPEEVPLALEPAAQTTGNPAIDLQLARTSFRQGDTVRTGAFWITNPTAQQRDVEVKTWMEFPGTLPAPLDLIPQDELSLVPGFSNNYGVLTLLKISRTAPSGTIGANARLLDPVKGDVVSEDLNSFTIIGSNLKKTKTQPAEPQVSGVAMESYAAETGTLYMIANTGSMSEAVEFKVWMESPGLSPIPVLSVGSDGSFILPAGADVTVDPLATLKTAPPAGYILKARVLDSASGDILAEK